MDGQAVFAELKTILADLYLAPADAQRIAADAGLELTQISFDTKAINNWHNILAVAIQSNALDVLLDKALGEYRQNQSLVSICETYRQFIAVGGQLEAPSITNALHPRPITNLTPLHPGNVPPLPSLIIGREGDLNALKIRLGIMPTKKTSVNLQILTTIYGWPGVGKTTIAAALAHESEVAAAFPDGVLWTSLGQNPNLLSELKAWGRACGIDDLDHARTLKEASSRLGALLRTQRRLLIIDDVWEPEHAIPFKIGGSECTTLITTRLNKVAQYLAPTPEAIYTLPVLADEKALILLQTLAPDVVRQHPQESLELVRALEGLPLALQVAGRLLRVEADNGFDVIQLLAELHEGVKLLEAQAIVDLEEGTATVRVLLQKSTNVLDEQTREHFAFLGAFAPKPATFDLETITSLWEVNESDAKQMVLKLVERGLLQGERGLLQRELLEPINGRFQMHALLVMHAQSFLK